MDFIKTIKGGVSIGSTAAYMVSGTVYGESFFNMHPDNIEASKKSISQQEIRTFTTGQTAGSSINAFINLSLFDKVERSLFDYKNLEEGWDGYDGIAASDETISSALVILSEIKNSGLKAPSPMLSSSGTIGFYWDKDSSYVQINIKPGDMYFEYIEEGDKYYGEDNKQITDPLSEKLITTLS